MLSSAILVLACWVAVRHLVGLRCWLLAPALTFLLANLALLSLANAFPDPRPSILVLGLLCLAARRRWPAGPLVAPSLGRWGWLLFGLLAGLIWTVTSLCQNLYPDDDFWIHFPLQGQLALWGPPALHPFFPDIALQGHYGRDLILGALSGLTGWSPITCQFWQTNLAQLASLALMVGLVWRSCGSVPAALLSATFAFLGINVGGRAGLLDTYQNNNALAYLGVLGMLVLFDELWDRPDLPRVLLTAWALGTYALVYETHFGLLGLLLIAMLVVKRRKEILLAGALALALAGLQGGPIAGLYRQWRQPVERTWSYGELNQHQVVKLTFPKEPFLHIPVTGGTYSRLSCAYQCLPSLGALTELGPERYRPLWSWHVLRIHWLSTLLAPLSLLLILRRPVSRIGLAFWSLGFCAYLTPGLVHFGPVFEAEYFRWQFAAGFAWSLALGLGLGRWLSAAPESGSRRRGLFAALLVLANLFPVWLLFVPRVLSQARQPLDALRPRSQEAWVTALGWELSNFFEADYRAALAARQHALAGSGDRILLNSPCTSARDIFFDSTFAGISGLRPVGHSMPWLKDPVGTPPFRRSAPATAFWSYPSAELLDQMGAHWVLLRPDEFLPPASAVWLAAEAEKVWARDGYHLYRWKPRAGGAPVTVSSDTTASPGPQLGELPGKLRPGQLVPVEPRGGEGGVWAWGFVLRDSDPAGVELREIVSWKAGPCALLAPSSEGEYDLRLYRLAEGGKLVPTPVAIPVTVEQLRRPERA